MKHLLQQEVDKLEIISNTSLSILEILPVFAVIDNLLISFKLIFLLIAVGGSASKEVVTEIRE